MLEYTKPLWYADFSHQAHPPARQLTELPPSRLLFSQADGGCGATNIFFSGKASLRNSCPHPFSCVNTAVWGAVWQFGWLTWSHKKNIWEGVFLYTWLMSVVWSEGTLHSREDTELQQEWVARGWKILKTKFATSENIISWHPDDIPTLHGFTGTYKLHTRWSLPVQQCQYVSWMETHPQVSTGSPPETLPAQFGAFRFSLVGCVKASHRCVETLHASRARCHSMGFIKKRLLGDVNPMRNREMMSDAPLGRGVQGDLPSENVWSVKLQLVRSMRFCMTLNRAKNVPGKPKWPML